MNSSEPKLFTIPPGVDFTAALARGVLQDAQTQNITLPNYLLLLPTRRACRAARDAFLKLTCKNALLLPRLQPLGDWDDQELSFAEISSEVLAIDDIPPVISPKERRIRLSALLQRHNPSIPADSAYLLAGALADLLDQTQIENIGFERLQKIVPEELAQHWQEVLNFLQLITEEWPRILAAEGLIDPAMRRNLMLQKQVALWVAQPPQYPVIAAGSTGSMPATAALLNCIARLPRGAVILPGLDQSCSEAVWDEISATHPQYLMKSLLDSMKITRRHVQVWPGTMEYDSARTHLLQDALTTATGTAQWANKNSRLEGLRGLERCDCETQEEEARVIALRLRHALTDPGRTAMLVTRDRKLAERVTAQMRRWDITINDSAGRSLGMTECGSFLSLVAAASMPEASATDLLALLQHPFTALGYNPTHCRELSRLAEFNLWRGRRLRGNILTHIHATESAVQRKEIPLEAAREIIQLLTRLEIALHPFAALLTDRHVTLHALLETHMAAAETLAADHEKSGHAKLWQHDDGEAAAELMQNLMEATHTLNLAQGQEYLSLFRNICAEETVRPRFGIHARLSILGPLEARLIAADYVILGGLNESSWPNAVPADPWMSRPMRRSFGLPDSERQIGQAAHDFLHLASHPNVLLTRAKRVDGQPTVTSRFLMRLETLLLARGLDQNAMHPALTWLEWAKNMDKADSMRPMTMPRPCPTFERRPRKFSVTKVGLWRQNPYGFYAYHVLRLKPLKDLDPDFTHADLGTIIHDILAKFITKHKHGFPTPETAAAALLRLGRDDFVPIADQPSIFATSWAKFENSVRWFTQFEYQRRQENYRPLAQECPGLLTLNVDGTDYKLTGRADRIDSAPNGLSIIDYKTGQPPSSKKVRFGIEPQMPLLGMMAQGGAFPDIPSQQVVELLYLSLKGRLEYADEDIKISDPQKHIEEAKIMLETSLHAYADPTMPYLVAPQPRYIPSYDDYRHLGRIDEWGSAEEAA